MKGHEEMSEEGTTVSDTFRAGYVAIIGQPNVGKSTLMNALVGQKISIVTNKPQTTRHKILGIASRPEAQAIFLDTPGILEPRYKLQEAMMKAARTATQDADIVILMIDATSPQMDADIAHDVAFNWLKSFAKRVYLVINKIDQLPKEDVIPIIGFYSTQFQFEEIFPVSALKSDGTDKLLSYLLVALPVHPPYYPLDIISQHPERFFVSEIIREKIFEDYREEIPYSTSVDIVEFKEQAGKKDLIEAEIYVERESQKGILIGKKGAALKQIGERSRKDIELFLGRPVMLKLFVKVREKWRNQDEWVQRLGYH